MQAPVVLAVEAVEIPTRHQTERGARAEVAHLGKEILAGKVTPTSRTLAAPMLLEGAAAVRVL
jgi:hypothetical protein